MSSPNYRFHNYWTEEPSHPVKEVFRLLIETRHEPKECFDALVSRIELGIKDARELNNHYWEKTNATSTKED